MPKARSKTSDDALRQYEIGEKLRALRLRKKMGLVELGDHTGLSPGLLSRIERSLVWPPLPTLLRIAMVFGVGLDHFFTDERKVIGVVRKDERQVLEQAMGEVISFRFQSLDYTANERKTSAWLAEFEHVDAESAEPHEHPGSEFLFILGGKLRIVIGRQDIELSKGDSIYFESSVPHWYSKLGAARCEAIVVTSR